MFYAINHNNVTENIRSYEINVVNTFCIAKMYSARILLTISGQPSMIQYF